MKFSSEAFIFLFAVFLLACKKEPKETTIYCGHKASPQAVKISANENPIFLTSNSIATKSNDTIRFYDGNLQKSGEIIFPHEEYGFAAIDDHTFITNSRHKRVTYRDTNQISGFRWAGRGPLCEDNYQYSNTEFYKTAIEYTTDLNGYDFNGNLQFTTSLEGWGFQFVSVNGVIYAATVDQDTAKSEMGRGPDGIYNDTVELLREADLHLYKISSNGTILLHKKVKGIENNYNGLNPYFNFGHGGNNFWAFTDTEVFQFNTNFDLLQRSGHFIDDCQEGIYSVSGNSRNIIIHSDVSPLNTQPYEVIYTVDNSRQPKNFRNNNINDLIGSNADYYWEYSPFYLYKRTHSGDLIWQSASFGKAGVVDYRSSFLFACNGSIYKTFRQISERYLVRISPQGDIPTIN